MKSYKFYSLDGVNIDLICDIFIKMLSNEMDRVRHFNYNNYEWCVGVNAVQRINNINGKDTLDALRYATEAAKFLNFGIGEKEGDIMPTKYNQMFKGNLCFIFRAEIKDVIFNNPATIILWKDGTKTVVKCGEGEAYDPEKGMAMAIAKKLLGNQGNYYDTFKKYLGEYEKKKPDLFKDVNETHEHEYKPGRYATVKELSKKIGVSESTIRGQIRKGQFPGAIKQDGVWLIPVSW